MKMQNAKSLAKCKSIGKRKKDQKFGKSYLNIFLSDVFSTKIRFSNKNKEIG